MTDSNYCTRKIYNTGEQNITVDENLTREEARSLVLEDINVNPNCDTYMLTFDRM